MTISGPAVPIVRRFERLTGQPLDAWSGLEQLIDAEVPESSTLDFKRLPYNDPNKDKQAQNDELRKDVTALANAIGGILVLGMTDNDGKPGVLQSFGDLEAVEGQLRSVIGNRIWPPIDHVQIEPVRKPSTTTGCLLVIVPASPRAPHAVEPHADKDALKYALRVGRHTQWLQETQVADRYRNRFEAAREQTERMAEILADLRSQLPKRNWLLLGVVPDVAGQFVVSRERVLEAQSWWGTRRRFGLLPPLEDSPADASAGPRRVRLSHSNGTTSVASEVYAELHDDGACGLALELADGPTGNPAFYLDHLIAMVFEGIVTVVDFTVSVAAAGGYGLLAACLHFPSHPDAEIQAWDPSWTPPGKQLPAVAKTVETAHTVDLDAIQEDAQEAAAAAGLVAGHLAQHFGEPDARYITPDGAIRVNQYSAPIRDKQVLPQAAELGIATSDAL